MSDSPFNLYQGNGATLFSRGRSLPLYEPGTRLDDPALYLANSGLRNAVNVSLALGQPLLVTGEPGTGKTQLAASIAHELNLGQPLVFHAKTTSTARDLFYRHDAMRQFHDSQFRRDSSDPRAYVTFEALGLAILLSLPPERADPFLPEPLRTLGPCRSVVLIDEIDKAPRDLPNDVLDEIETMSFTSPELGESFRASPAYRPILLLTSNSEKNLPDAFLRRCVFYHIPFPDRDRLREILSRRLDPASSFSPRMLDHAIAFFERIRDLPLKKKPATAECLAWIRILERTSIDVANLQPGQAETLLLSYSVLAKSKEDLGILDKTIPEQG